MTAFLAIMAEDTKIDYRYKINYGIIPVDFLKELSRRDKQVFPELVHDLFPMTGNPYKNLCI